MAQSTKAMRAAVQYTCMHCQASKATKFLSIKEVGELLEYQVDGNGRTTILQPGVCNCINIERISSLGIHPADVTYGIVGKYNVRIIFEGPYSIDTLPVEMPEETIPYPDDYMGPEAVVEFDTVAYPDTLVTGGNRVYFGDQDLAETDTRPEERADTATPAF